MGVLLRMSESLCHKSWELLLGAVFRRHGEAEGWSEAGSWVAAIVTERRIWGCGPLLKAH